MFAKSHDWISVGQTQLPAPPRATVLTLREVSPQRFEVTFPVEAKALTAGIGFLIWALLMLPLMIGAILLAAFIPQIPVYVWMFGALLLPFWLAVRIGRQFRRPDGGRLCLERPQFSAAGGNLVRWSRDYPLGPTSKFTVVATNDSDDSRSWLLNLTGSGKEVTVCDDCVVGKPDLQWIHDRFNEWLGWEFPSHCIACGRVLELADLNWPERRIECSGCGFHGPAPDPFPPDAIPAAPPAACPNCADPNWLTQINRATGGSRCHTCGWESKEAPPLHPRDFSGIFSFCTSFLGRLIAAQMEDSPHRVSDDELAEEFPTLDAAWTQLANENLLDRQAGRLPQIAYRHWQTRGLPAALSAAGVGITVLIVLLATVLGGSPQDRTALASLAVWVVRLALLVLIGLLVTGIWWARRHTVLVFSPDALAWDYHDGRRRVVTWHTLTDAATQRSGWPPMLILVHGGAGILFSPPTRSSARAITRTCLFHRDQVHRSPLYPPVIDSEG